MWTGSAFLFLPLLPAPGSILFQYQKNKFRANIVEYLPQPVRMFLITILNVQRGKHG